MLSWSGAARWLVALIASLLVFADPVDAATDAARPVTLMISYKTRLPHRVAFRRYWLTEGRRSLSRWKQDNAFTHARLLFSRFAAAPADAILVIDFARFGDLERWMTIERQAPGGLLGKGATLADVQTTTVMHAIAHAEEPSNASPVYLVASYALRAEPDEYSTFVDGYVVPQTSAWLQAGVIASYAMYIDEYVDEGTWHSTLLLRYNGLENLARRDTIKASVRQRLASNPQWKDWSNRKAALSVERTIAVFEEVADF